MEALNCASMGAMGSLLWKLDKLPHTAPEAEDQAQAIRQLRNGVANIRTKLVELSEVHEQHESPLTANYWMKEARELSYDMEDCVDQFVLADSESDAKVAFADEISGFRIRVAEVMERYYRFKLGYVLSCPTVINKASACPRLRRASGDTNRVALVGIECQINELVGLLKPNNGGDERELQLKVVSILGVEGVGKSTVAQELWRVLGEEFECRAFVHAAKKPNMRLILTNILLQIRPNHPPEVCRVPNLIQDITNHLQDKRFFLGSYITLYMHSLLLYLYLLSRDCKFCKERQRYSYVSLTRCPSS